MRFSGCADKIAGLVAIAGWGTIAAKAAEWTALAEPVSSAAILSTQLAIQLRQNKQHACADAINSIRKQTERAIEQSIGRNREFADTLQRAFDDFDEHLPQLCPSMDDLVRLWRLQPKAIADGLLTRFSEKSEVIANNHLARQAIEHVLVQAVEAFKDDPNLFQKLEPTLARQMLADLGGLQDTLDSVAAEQRRQGKMLETIAGQLEMRGGVAVLDAKISRLEHEIQLDKSDLMELLRNIVDRGVKADQIDPTLTTMGENLNRSRSDIAHLASLADEVPDIAPRVAAAQAALDSRSKLNLGVAQDEMRAARGIYRQAVQARRHAEAINLARIGEAEGSIALARFEYAEAAHLFAEAARELPEEEKQLAVKLRTKQADALYEYGTRLNDPTSLKQAADTYGLVLTIASDKEPASASDWATAQNNLGNTFQRLADCLGGQSGRAYLARAISAYKAALSVRTGHGMREDWAMTQNGLASVLQRLGGGDNLRQALDACDAALSVHTRRDMPAKWAMTKNNLGNVLRSLAACDDEERDWLNDAAKAYADALSVLSPDDVPVQWAMTQNNLGDVLQSIGDREQGEIAINRFRQAIDAHNAALTVLSVDGMPALWAISKNSLGIALQSLSDRLEGDAGITMLGDAVEAYRDALTAHSEEGLNWAAMQNNLAVALIRYGTRVGGQARSDSLSRAYDAFSRALTVYVEKDMGAECAAVESNLQFLRNKIATN